MSKKKKFPNRNSSKHISGSDAWAMIENGNIPTQTVPDAFVGRRRNMLLGKKNAGETMALALLNSIEAKFVREKPFRVGRKLFFCDFFVERLSDGKRVCVALEIDGSIHKKPEVIIGDMEKNEALLSLNHVFSVVRITVPRLRSMKAYDLDRALRIAKLGVVTNLA